MKKVLFSLLCLTFSAAAVNAQDAKNAHPNAANAVHQAAVPAAPQVDPRAGKFKFDEVTYDFGQVPEGPLAECDFKFKNVGKEPIVITEAHGSCGCTVPHWPKDPILPRKKGVIHVTYNTQGRVGMINKDVYITSNAQQNPMRLHITGTVVAKVSDANKK